jgi:ribosomal protein S18 acetylase RimI-like enzyme
MTEHVRAGRVIRAANMADVKAIARVDVESWRTTYAGLIPDGYLASLDVAERAGRWEGVMRRVGGQAFYVAEEHGDIVGYAYGGPGRDQDPVFRGELYALYLVKQAQGRGWGRALMGQVAAHLVGQGMSSMLVWVLRDNVAGRGFYERLGGVRIGEHLLVFEGISVPEVSYGWRDAHVLVPPQ